MRTLNVVVGMLALFLSACGTAYESGRIPSSRELLTAEEIARSGALTAYDAVRARRPAFLTPQGPKAVLSNPRATILPSVYLNGMYYGDVETLKNLSASEIREIRFIEAKDATIKYGTGHVAGVILVIMKTN